MESQFISNQRNSNNNSFENKEVKKSFFSLQQPNSYLHNYSNTRDSDLMNISNSNNKYNENSNSKKFDSSPQNNRISFGNNYQLNSSKNNNMNNDILNSLENNTTNDCQFSLFAKEKHNKYILSNYVSENSYIKIPIKSFFLKFFNELFFN